MWHVAMCGEAFSALFVFLPEAYSALFPFLMKDLFAKKLVEIFSPYFPQ